MKHRILAVGVWILMSASLAGAADVTVTREAPQVTRKTFDPKNLPDPAPPLKDGAIAVCEYKFNLTVDFQVIPGAAKQVGDQWTANLRINTVKVGLALPVTVWTPNDADDFVKTHEDTHRLIAERYYKDADKLARTIANNFVGRGFEGKAADRNAAYGAAITKAAQELQAKYSAATMEPCERAQNLFDELTKFSRNRDIDHAKAMDQAIKQADQEMKDKSRKPR